MQQRAGCHADVHVDVPPGPSYTRRLDRHLFRTQRTRIDVDHTSNSLGIEYQSFFDFAPDRTNTTNFRIRYKTGSYRRVISVIRTAWRVRYR